MASTYFFVLLAFFCVICLKDGVKAACGGFIQSTSGVITSPYYPSKYPPNHRCTWEIRMPSDYRIGLRFKHIRMEGCSNDFVTVRSRLESGSLRDHGKYCTLPKGIILSESNVLLVEFVSDGSVEYEGFEVEFFNVFSQCGRFIEQNVGAITSPRFNSSYPPNQHCTWTIQAPLDHTIKFKFESFVTEPQDNCNFDYVTVQSKMADGVIREHGKFCGLSLNSGVMISESNVLIIQFVSDRSVQHAGFLGVFSFEKCGGVVEGSKGNISTPFFPNPYPPNKMCEWTIPVPRQHKLKLRFLRFEIEEGGKDCTNDFLLIQSKSAEGEIRDYGKYCGDLEHFSIYSNDTIILKFVSDRRFQRTGFQAEYFVDKWSDYEISTSLRQFSTASYLPDISTTTEYGISYRWNNQVGNFIPRNEIDPLPANRLLTSKNSILKDGRKKQM